LIWHLNELTENNFDYVKIFLNEKDEKTELVIKTFINHLGDYIENSYPNDKIDYPIFAFSIFSFVYFITFDKKQGRIFLDHKESIEKFIDHLVILIQS
jgi:hypothetical protein